VILLRITSFFYIRKNEAIKETGSQMKVITQPGHENHNHIYIHAPENM